MEDRTATQGELAELLTQYAEHVQVISVTLDDNGAGPWGATHARVTSLHPRTDAMRTHSFVRIYGRWGMIRSTPAPSEVLTAMATVTP